MIIMIVELFTFLRFHSNEFKIYFMEHTYIRTLEMRMFMIPIKHSRQTAFRPASAVVCSKFWRLQFHFYVFDVMRLDESIHIYDSIMMCPRTRQMIYPVYVGEDNGYETIMLCV